LVLPIPLATAAAATMVIVLPDTACTSQFETRVLGVVANVGSRAKGDSSFIYAHV
jgi:hypothetical protein